MHFSLVLKQQVGRVLLRAEFVLTLWSGEVCVAAQSPESPGLKVFTKPLVCDTQSCADCLHVLMWSSMNEVTFRFHQAVVRKCSISDQVCIKVPAYSTWMCCRCVCVSGSNVKEFPFIFYNATAKESNCQKRDLSYLYEPEDLWMDHCHLLYNSFLHFNLLQRHLYIIKAHFVYICTCIIKQFNLMLLFLKCVFQSAHQGQSEAVYICEHQIIPDLLQLLSLSLM